MTLLLSNSSCQSCNTTMLLLFVMLALVGTVKGWQRNVAYGSYEVYSTSDLGFPVDKILFACNGTLQVPVTDGHRLSPSEGQIRYYDMDGTHQKTFRVPDISTTICGLARNPATDDIMLLDTGLSKLFKLIENPCSFEDGDELHVGEYASIPESYVNDMSFDEWGNVYITDTILGHIYFVPFNGGDFEYFVEMVTPTPSGAAHPLSSMRPAFGVTNGIVYDQARSLFYVGHFGRGTLIRLHVRKSSSKRRLLIDDSEFEFGIEEWRCCFNALDGLTLDTENDYLYFSQENSWGITVMDVTSGRIVFSYGDFNGIHKVNDRNQADGQLGASSSFLHEEEYGQYIYVANLNFQSSEWPMPGYGGSTAGELDYWMDGGLMDYMSQIDEHTIIKYKIDTDAYLTKSGRRERR